MSTNTPASQTTIRLLAVKSAGRLVPESISSQEAICIARAQEAGVPLFAMVLVEVEVRDISS